MGRKIQVFAINLEERIDRFNHIGHQFFGKVEFDFSIFRCKREINGAAGLWNNIVGLVTKAKNADLDFFIICEDDHKFSKEYNYNFLIKRIQEADVNGADILSGGVSWFRSGVRTSENLFWVNRFSGLQFTIIYKRFFETIINADFHDGEAADLKMSDLSNNVFVMYPYISTQKEFGYSDVTAKNNERGYVGKIFRIAHTKFSQLVQVHEYYKLIQRDDRTSVDFDDLVIPTFVISRTTFRLDSIKRQFIDKAEFDLVIESCSDQGGDLSLWQAIVKIVRFAKINAEDAIVICQEDHEFTSTYTKEVLFRNIIEGSLQGAELLSGGTNDLGQIVQVSEDRYWINPLFTTQFLVLYSTMYDKILKYSFKRNDSVKDILTFLTSHKMLIFPFISISRNFETPTLYVDNVNEHPEVCNFSITSLELKRIKDVYYKYNRF